MPGFPLAAIGAGLGLWAKNQQEQQAARERQQMLALQLQRYQQEQQDRQQERQSAESLWGAAGGAGIKPVNPMGGVGMPIQQAALSFDAARSQPAPSGGVDRAVPSMPGGGPLGGRGDALSGFAPGNRSEGITVTDRAPSAESYAGLSGPGAPTAPTPYTTGTMPQDTRGALPPGTRFNSRGEAISGDLSRDLPGQRIGASSVGPNPDFRAASPRVAAQRTATSAEFGPAETQMADASGATPPASTGPIPIPDLRKRLNAIIPPDVNGRMSEAALKAKIDQACPTCPAVYKLKYLDSELKRLAPMEAERVRTAHDLYKTQIDAETKMWEEENRQRREADKGEVKESEGVQYRVKGATATPITVAGTGQPLGAPAKPGKPQLLEYTKEDGTVERVEAQQMRNGQWVTADQLRAPIDVSKGKWSIVPASQASALGGSRDAAQRERQLIAGREVISDLQNVVALPMTTTRGIFGGRSQGPGLLDALKENLAEKMTDEDAELANSALAGLERELSIIVSPVYGGKWAAESFGALKLKEGQTNSVKLYNLARMRQTADNALEAMTTSPRIGEAQKQYAKDMRDMLDKAVPWTPADVLAYRSKGDDRQTFGQFVAEQGIGGSAAKGERPQGAAGPKEGDVASAPGKPDLVFRGGKWVPVQ